MTRRRLTATAVAVATLAAVPAAAPAPAAAASSYCSPSGDFCHGARRIDGRVTLWLETFSFRGRVTACVTPPGGAQSCKSFRLRTGRSGISSMRARWSAHFPRRGAGTYRVRFRYAGTAIGEPVTFRIG